MGKTYKDKNKVTDKQGPKKMRPYVADKDLGRLKYVAEDYEGYGTTKKADLVAKNANRSRKKAARRELNNFNDELNEDYDNDYNTNV